MKHKLFFLPLLLVTACSTGGSTTQNSSLEVHSMGLDRAILFTNCTTIVCVDGFANEGDIWMTDIPMDQIQTGDFSNGQIIHLQILWTPVAGKTPLASTSTNLTIKHIIISDGVVGVYGGGGYCWKYGTPSEGLSLNIEEATIALQSQSEHFNDLLSPATMVGKISSVPNRQVANQISNAAQRVLQ
ncbi:MAG TPA: hypothetical protein EYO01_01730 [Phycisphaerales bacterium]|nr:hypothetical protein [Phycisphaerales bacterium]HIB01341.1 hypothetical protein [Phycisphaerales bacterium]HIB49735.1 hypothetical protein [Phycisphaerales bacterium]HIN84268.1 hypothetical protein [Phycisphaerales bacterium]HIO52979.1 hypothetical protein [Phycisphaerales bacterium]